MCVYVCVCVCVCVCIMEKGRKNAEIDKNEKKIGTEKERRKN